MLLGDILGNLMASGESDYGGRNMAEVEADLPALPVCPDCGSNLPDVVSVARCPECGSEAASSVVPKPEPLADL